MTIFNWQSNLRGLFGNRLRATGVIALGIGWALSSGCAGELDPNRDYSWAFNDSLGGMTGQGGSGNGQGGMTVTAPPDPPCLEPLMSTQCSNSCHGALFDAIGGGLDLRGPNLGQKLLNKPSSCAATPPIIDGSNPNNSTFLKKCSNGSTACGGPMPQGSMGLMGADLKCVQDWIASFNH